MTMTKQNPGEVRNLPYMIKTALRQKAFNTFAGINYFNHKHNKRTKRISHAYCRKITSKFKVKIAIFNITIFTKIVLLRYIRKYGS